MIPGSFGIQEKPLPRVGNHLRSARHQQTQRRRIHSLVRHAVAQWRAIRFHAVRYIRKPFSQRQMLAILVLYHLGAEKFRQPLCAFGNIRRISESLLDQAFLQPTGPCHRSGTRGILRTCVGRFLQRLHSREPIQQCLTHAQRCSKSLSATSLVLSLFSPAGPTHDGHPCSHGHARINSRVRRNNKS